MINNTSSIGAQTAVKSDLTDAELKKMLTQDELLLRVDESNQVLGPIGKVEAHRSPGTQHRAFTAILEDKEGRIALAQRSSQKPLWPLFWDISCSSHPWFPNETAPDATIRRVPFELGIQPAQLLQVKELGKYSYRSVYNQDWVEHEWNYIVWAQFSGFSNPRSEEIAQVRMEPIETVSRLLRSGEIPFAPWVEQAWEMYLSSSSLLEK